MDDTCCQCRGDIDCKKGEAGRETEGKRERVIEREGEGEKEKENQREQKLHTKS